MKVIEKGNYKARNWKIKAECAGNWWQRRENACHSLLEVEASDIVRKLNVFENDDGDECYGFICMECHCFTEVREHIIPNEVKRNCLRIADKGTIAYRTLTDEEKKRSDQLR